MDELVYALVRYSVGMYPPTRILQGNPIQAHPVHGKPKLTQIA